MIKLIIGIHLQGCCPGFAVLRALVKRIGDGLLQRHRPALGPRRVPCGGVETRADRGGGSLILAAMDVGHAIDFLKRLRCSQQTRRALWPAPARRQRRETDQTDRGSRQQFERHLYRDTGP